MYHPYERDMYLKVHAILVQELLFSFVVLDLVVPALLVAQKSNHVVIADAVLTSVAVPVFVAAALDVAVELVFVVVLDAAVERHDYAELVALDADVVPVTVVGIVVAHGLFYPALLVLA